MVIEKKQERPINSNPQEPEEIEIEKLIKKGGSAPKAEIQVKKQIVFNLRMSTEVVSQIDNDREKQGGFFSRNAWILQAIQEKLNRS
jgi:predicted HicB family RNase H-like nuclease